MTDKQIIIDGCNVSALYSDEIACMNRYEVARLFIKTIELLVAKEQECKKLKEANNTLTVTREKLLGDLWITEESLKDYKEHYNKADDEPDQLKAENEKLKQTITEIKEIAKKSVKTYDYLLGMEFTELVDKILQKISEYEVENEN